MDRPTYIASCSFGKDSIATILLALEHNEPLDRVVFAEVMFDHSRGISGEIPEHIEWVYSTAIPKLESMGVKVDVVRSKHDYCTMFFAELGARSSRCGQLLGFPFVKGSGGGCGLNRPLKLKPIRDYFKQFENCKTYVGIAKDEPRRLGRLDGMKEISLLDKYGYTEDMAKQKCKEYDLLSPIYGFATRNGCWFCPNARYEQLAHIKYNHPHLWAELERLSETPNLCSYGFKYGKTVQEVEKLIDWNDRQLKLF